VFTRHNHTSGSLTATWLLPVVPPITIAAVGSSLCTLLIAKDRLDYALIIFITSYVMLGVGLLLAIAIMVIYFQRLALHHCPAREVIVSTFLPLGEWINLL
jgi:tellurite resistance protein TehA-like permease